MKTNFGANVDMIVVKIIVVAVLAVIMLLPITMIENLIEGREQNQQSAQEDITNKWGGSQCITGPVLVLPYESGLDKNQNPIINYAYFLPDDYKVDGEINTEERSRTLFNTLVYQSDLKISGKFALPDYAKLNIKSEQVRWQNAFVLLGIPYLQGIKSKINFVVNGKPLDVQPGVRSNNVIDSGVTINMPIDSSAQIFEFSFDLGLNGSEGLYFTPIGKENRIHLKSPWNTVSFNGDFLPSDRRINEQGFDASWNVFDYNRNYVQMWTGGNDVLKKSNLGVDFKYPVDKYQMTMRSVKYAIIFIVLTFVVFFLVELLSKKRIHPVQYLLVSCALVLFYTLLLAISEHLSFGISYLIAAAATTLLITVYSTTMFRNMKQTTIMAMFLIALYVYLYIILQQENMALLFGAIGLFVALAVVMFVLRKVDWYKDRENRNNVNVEIEKDEDSSIHIYTRE
ncbi:cell envelope integrity protein CreD [Dysgonomonas sp. Marseille-P4677]|uniref:cell envelope integrity protein CreD n=1 Tax=Dysgonomonas sp. Marseille-P4677 TaxID=2364790 RepID=UPI001912BAA5|nr:cell envelope integrity protein CreD [Dysgonomonas sp. Marseille-P4677]MBK5722207.1 cell envelope integrity protein CreD [Dysgonomonas sp. Marseille-P4677]